MMLSCLSRGSGSWNGDYEDVSIQGHDRRKCKSALSRLSSDQDFHRHGITITPDPSPRAKSAGPDVRTSDPMGQITLPKTFLTRKGALLLFSSIDNGKSDGYLHHGYQNFPTGGNKEDNLIDLSLKLGTLERLTLSVLQYGDQNFDPATCSVTDTNNKLFLKFLKKLQEDEVDLRTRPGGDLEFYLNRLRYVNSNSRFNHLSSPDVQELKSALHALESSHSPVADQQNGESGTTGCGGQSRPGTAPAHRSRQMGSVRSSTSAVSRSGVLSADRLTASLKSSSHLDKSLLDRPRKTSTSHGWSPLAVANRTQHEDPSLLSATITRRSNSPGNLSNSATTESSWITPAEQSPHHVEQQHVHGSPQRETTPLLEILLDADKSVSETELFALHESLGHTDPLADDAHLSQTLHGHDTDLFTELHDPIKYVENGISERGRRLSAGSVSSSVPEEQDIHFPQEANGEGGTANDRKQDERHSQTKSPSSQQGDGDMAGATHPLMPQYTGYFAAGPPIVTLSQTLTSKDNGIEKVADYNRVPQILPHTMEPMEAEKGSPGKSTGEEVESRAESRTSSRSSLQERVERGLSPIERAVPASSPVDFTVLEESLKPAQQEAKSSPDIGETTSGHLSEGRSPASMKSVPKCTNTDLSDLKAKTVNEAERGPSTAPPAPVLGPGGDRPGPDMKLETIVIPRPGTADSSPQQASMLLASSKDSLQSTPTNKLSFDDLKKLEQSIARGSKSEYVKALHITSVQPEQDNQPSPSMDEVSKTAKEVMQDHSQELVTHSTTHSSPMCRVKSPPVSHENATSLVKSPSTPLYTPRPPTDSPPAKTRTMRTSAKVDLAQQPSTEGKTTEDQSATRSIDKLLAKAVGQISTDDLNQLQKMKSETRPEVKSAGSPRKERRLKGGKGRRKADPDLDGRRQEEEQQTRRKRREEAQWWEQQIRKKETQRLQQQAEAERLRGEYRLQMEGLENEAREMRQAEEDALEQMAAVRQTQHAERLERRQQELERKKEYAIKYRQRERKLMEEARKKELEMLASIGDEEMRKRLAEEEARKSDEQERLAQERFEEEIKQMVIEAEDQEERMRELERQAEEEAMKHLKTEKSEVERRRRQLLEETERLDQQDQQRQQEIEEEKQQLVEERNKKEFEEELRRQEEISRQKLIQRTEAEDREKLRQENEVKRLELVKRRRKNLERRTNLEKVRHTQGISRSYIFSYYINWPRETYERSMGVDKKKKSGIRTKKPKTT